MPKLVLDLIEIGWKELLVGVCVREGEESTEFLEDASVLKTLVDWCKGESSYAFDIELEAPAILELVDSQLAVSSAGLAPTKPILHELKQIFYAGKKAELITIEESDLGFEFDRVGSRDKAEIPARIKEQGNDERWLERVHRMQVGDWVECRDKGGKASVCA